MPVAYAVRHAAASGHEWRMEHDQLPDTCIPGMTSVSNNSVLENLPPHPLLPVTRIYACGTVSAIACTSVMA